jgi:hypothetical protein
MNRQNQTAIHVAQIVGNLPVVDVIRGHTPQNIGASNYFVEFSGATNYSTSFDESINVPPHFFWLFLVTIIMSIHPFVHSPPTELIFPSFPLFCATCRAD